MAVISIYIQWKMPSALPDDFSHFNIYRGPSCAEALTEIGETDDDVDSEGYYHYTDVSGEGGFCYRISAEDIYNNESASVCVCYYDMTDYLCRVYTYLVDAESNPVKIEGLARITSLPEDYIGKFWSGQEVAKYSDEDTGYIHWDLPRGAVVNFIIYDMKINIQETIPDVSSKALNDWID